MMVFIRNKPRNGKNYYYIVENKREGQKTFQKVIYYLGPIETIIRKMKIADETIKNKKP